MSKKILRRIHVYIVDEGLREAHDKLEFELDMLKKKMSIQYLAGLDEYYSHFTNGNAVRVVDRNDSPNLAAEWRCKKDEYGLVLRWPHKIDAYDAYGYQTTNKTRVSYSACVNKEGEILSFPPGTIGYVVSDRSPYKRQKSVLIKVTLRGWTGYAHRDNFEPYYHDEEDK